MKKNALFVLGALFLSINIISCTSDDDNKNSYSEKIIGKWEFYRETELEDDEIIFVDLYDHACETEKDFLEFFANNTYTFVMYDEDCTIWDTETTQWSISGDVLTIDVGDETGIAKIIELNDTRLTIEFTEMEDNIEVGQRIEFNKAQ